MYTDVSKYTGEKKRLVTQMIKPQMFLEVKAKLILQ